MNGKSPNCGALVIDDTGSPGISTGSRFLRKDRVTWCGLIVSPDERREFAREMAGCTEELTQQFGITEFHFADIYNGKGSWANIQPDLRLAIFNALAEIASLKHFHFLVQTFHKESLQDNGFIVCNCNNVDGFNLHDHSDAALVFLLIRFKIWAMEISFSLPVDVIVDEGRKRAGTESTHWLLNGIAVDSMLKYRSSAAEPLLQIADFGAYVLNRSQMLLCKEKRTNLDNQFLLMAEHADLQFLNLEKETVNLSTVSKDSYDLFQWHKYAKDGTLDRKRMAAEFKDFLSRRDQAAGPP